MPQDWFSANAPKPKRDEKAEKPSGDWFAANAPKADIAPPKHPHARVGNAVIDAVKGALTGPVSTMFHGGDLIRRGLGMERVIDRPEVKAAMTPPDSAAGKAGFMLEQAAEFGVPLAKIARVTKGMPILQRMAGEAAASAGVAGIQSGGDPTSMTVGAAAGAVLPFAAKGMGAVANRVKQAAAGAQEGGVTGALAGAVRNVAPPSSKAMLVQGLKPRATQRGFEKSLDTGIADLAATAQETGKAINGIDDLIETIGAAKKRVRAEYDAYAGPMRERGSLVDGNAVADLMEKSIPSKVKLEAPEVAKRLMERAQTYRRTFPLEEAELLMKETNAELDSFYGKYPMAQRKALLSDPEAALLDAQGKAWRDAIYKTIDSDTQGASARAINRRYGALLDIEDAAVRRANVAKRQQPESLSEQIGNVRAAADMAKGAYKIAQGDLSGAADIAAGRAGREMAKYLKEQQTTDALIRRAFANVGSGKTVPRQGAR